MRFHYFTVAALTLLGTGSALSMAPVSYDMLNGNTGQFTYHDDSYSGTGCLTCDNAILSGGRGDLTDGVIATENWNITPGRYVGWTLDPIITFRWDSPVNVSAITFHFDDADGFGGVNAPESVVVDGQLFAIDDPVGSAPFSFTAGVAFSGSELTVKVNSVNVQWVFLSEVEFSATPVPEPTTYALMLAGLAVIGAAARRRAR